MDSRANHVTGRRRLGAVDRIRRHPIGSTILVAIAAVLATIALVVVGSGHNSALAASSLVNGSFETGDLTGWSVYTNTDAYGAGSSSASAITSYQTYHTCEDWYSCYYVTVSPMEGSYFALLTSWYQRPDDPQSEYTKISQPFEASTGDKISGWAFFEDKLGDNKGQVVITSDSGTTVAIPYEDTFGIPGDIGWRYWEYTFSGVTGTGQFQIEARVSNMCGCSVVGLDDVKISKVDPDTTKPSTSATRSVEPNTAGWNKENVTVRLNATDNQGGSGVQKITYSASGAQSIAQTDATGDSAEVALDQQGTTTLTYYATDKAGNVEDQKTLTVKIDKGAPTGSVTINDGASNTRSRSVTLSLSATDPLPGSGVSQMRISNTQSGLTSAPWEAYSTTKPWTLSSGQGTKTVYVQYRDGAGNRSGVVTDTIRFAR